MSISQQAVLRGIRPRFPAAMSLDVQLVVMDEVAITIAGFAPKASIDTAVTAYAEQLDEFVPCDIRVGFAEARRLSDGRPPTATQVRKAVVSARRRRLEPPRPREEELVVAMPPQFGQAWRAALSGSERDQPPRARVPEAVPRRPPNAPKR